MDDTTALEILPRNGIGLLNAAVNDIHKFSLEHNTKLNPRKCKEIDLGTNTVAGVTTYKLLCIIISNDFKWSEHIRLHLEKSLEAPVFPKDSLTSWC